MRMNQATPSQLGLFERSDTKPSRDEPRRIQLDETSWVEHVSGWLFQSEQLLKTLRESAEWEQRKRWMFTKSVEEPRLTAEYRSLPDAPLQLRTIASALSERYRITYDSAWLNLYRDHSDSTGWHADRSSSRRTQRIVPVLSLGATRRFLIRRRDGGPSTTFVVQDGDVIAMGGRCQKDWMHCVPKESRPAGLRISVNFASSEQMGG
jgi:alkylated DNA repair dioxygenase AlkB